MEQKSLENSPKEDKKTAPPIQPIAPPVTGPAQPQTSGASQPQGLPATPQASAPQNSTQQPAAQISAPQNPQPLTFYKNLQTGQKNTVLGSGINEKPRPAATPQQVSQTAAQQPKAPPHTGGYVVQVAAYKAFEEAKKLKKDLTDKGYTDVNVSEATLNDNVTWYRVRIGRHLDKEAATKIANKLLSSAKVLPDQD